LSYAVYSIFFCEARTLADVAAGGGSTTKETILYTGGVRSVANEKVKLFQDLVDGPPLLSESDKGKNPTYAEIQEQDIKAARAVEKRFARLAAIDKHCLGLNTASVIDYSREDPWDWYCFLIEKKTKNVCLSRPKNESPGGNLLASSRERRRYFQCV
jgi:hypothetical protein